METLHTTNTSNSNLQFRLRSILIVAGIVTAVICSLVSMNDIQLSEDVKANSPMERPTLTNANMLVNAALTIWSYAGRIN
jgi:hypothetical protein